MADKVQLFNPNDGVTGRDGGPYLDVVQAEEQERQRARVEGREPDFDNLPAHTGIPLQTAGQQWFTVGVNSNPSQNSRNDINSDVQFQAAVKDDEVALQAFSERDRLEELDDVGPTFGVQDTNPAAIATGAAADDEHTAGKGSEESDGKTAEERGGKTEKITVETGQSKSAPSTSSDKKS